MIKVRPLQKQDVDRAAALIPQLTLNILEPAELKQRLSDLVDLSNSSYLVVEKEGQLIGFGGLVWYIIPSKGLVGWIEEVVVDERCRGQGIGSILLKALLDLAEVKGLSQIKLTTGNDSARHLYEKFGFMKKEENLLVKKYYQL